LHGISSQNTELFKAIGVRISNPKQNKTKPKNIFIKLFKNKSAHIHPSCSSSATHHKQHYLSSSGATVIEAT
jgi:hypothetical protein